MEPSIAIIGAGIIGSALAHELCLRGIKNIHVLDVDLEGSFSSTERNAGGVRHLWCQPINAELSRLSIRFFETIRTEIGFQQNGYLWLYSQANGATGEEALRVANALGLDYSRLTASEIRSHYPFIDRTDDIEFGIFGPRDGILNSNALKVYLQKHAKAGGARFEDRVCVQTIEEKTGSVRLQVSRFPSREAAQKWLQGPIDLKPTDLLRFDKVVVSTGAWADHLLSNCGFAPLTRPVRRQVAIFSCEELSLTPYGMFVDTSGVYFHAEGGNTLAGLVLKEEPAGFNFDYDSHFFEDRIWPPLYERSSQFERLKFLTGWSGLYSYSPDITGIMGLVPGFEHVFESHSFTGHGIMHSIGAAQVLADRIVTGKFQRLDGSALSRERFARGTRLDETLHI